MSDHISPEDRALIDEINAAYQPPEPSLGFEARVMARVTRPALRRPPLWALAAAAAALLLWLALPSATPSVTPSVTPSAALSPKLAPVEMPQPEDQTTAWLDITEEEQQMLPDDYLMLAQIWAPEEEEG